ncbi:MAG TPA: 16S rRNA (cytosine(1402)-N(4))-methyltransferase RsmH [Bacteroidetes bacterium]|jgi:16S rRNA (cytosine1402-N4)-methyltransferase|nr:16S rRNA (cytosine(1402)-N(4))-methyltransferase RsmH [Bacteroidota bacterium]
MVYHIPALLEESVEGLNIDASGIYVDATFGGGGHTKEILKRLGPNGRVVAFDQDDDAVINVPDDKRLLFLGQNFRFLRNNLRYNGIDHINGLLADLGVSFHQFDDEERGFSFRGDGRLDMRMNRNSGRDASMLINNMEADKLADVLYYYGELANARQIAARIIAAREENPINTTGELLNVLGGFAPRGREHKFFAKVFQALRIEVNGEIEALKEMLSQALEMLLPGGRLSIITYHSLEDRLVKNFIRTGNFEGRENKDFYGNLLTPFKLINRKGTVPSDEEIERNNRARSARLRVAEKI